jgi:hypothetical protein
MYLLKQWWTYIFIVAFIYCGIGAIISETGKPSIIDAPYQTHDRGSSIRTLMFKDYTILDDANVLEINGYYESQFPLYGWKYMDKKLKIIGDKLAGYGVTKR